jgi:hypothetical protein
VYDIDVATQKARVMPVGDTLDSLMPVAFSLDKIPSLAMADNPSLGVNAPSDIVRVMKMNGSYFILDYFYGAPLPQVQPDSDVLHANPSFEDPRFIDGVPINYMARSYLQSGGWSMSLEPKDTVHGNFALKIFRANGATVRLCSEHGYQVAAGDTVRLSCWAKTSPGSQLLQMSVYTGSSEGAAQLFGGGGTQGRTFITSDYWAKYQTDFVMPAGHTWVRPEYFPWTIGSNDMTMWLDDTRATRELYVPWNRFDGSSSGGSNIYTTGWANYGGVYAEPAFRRVDDCVELRGLVTLSSGSSSTIATLPVGNRPTKVEIFHTLHAANNVIVRVNVNPDGTITFDPGTTLTVGMWFSFAGMRFSTI